MKQILLVVTSALGVGAALLAKKIISSKRKKENALQVRNKPANERKRNDVSAHSPSMAVKKDGSLDMRYKENKEHAGETHPQHSMVHLKKNGEPDKRYRENRNH